MGIVEDVEFDLDLDASEPPQLQATLRLHGDFVDECDRYLNDWGATWLSFNISRSIIEKLHHELEKVLYGA